jgi:hypothetical protein
LLKRAKPSVVREPSKVGDLPCCLPRPHSTRALFGPVETHRSDHEARQPLSAHAPHRPASSPAREPEGRPSSRAHAALRPPHGSRAPRRNPFYNALTLALVGDFERYDDPRAIVKLAGSEVNQYASGDWTARHESAIEAAVPSARPRISKRASSSPTTMTSGSARPQPRHSERTISAARRAHAHPYDMRTAGSAR